MSRRIKYKDKLRELHQIKLILKKHLKELIRQKERINDDIFDFTRFILEENVDAYESMIVLYKKGHLRSCLLLARSILENSVNLQYVYKQDSERRARNYILFSAKMSLERLKENKNNIQDKDGLIPFLERIVQNYSPSGNTQGHWDGMSVKKVFDDMEYGSIHKEYYSRLSGYSHSQFKAIRDLDQIRPYNDFLRKFVFRDLAIVVSSALKDINEKYNLLEGGIIISDYPQQGTDFLFTFSNSAIIQEVGQTLKNDRKDKYGK